jgi:hypothetical protein
MKARNWIALVLGTVVAVVVSYGAYELAGYSWNQVVDYRGPYAAVKLDPTPPGDRPTASRRVVFVIVDGLRDDASRRMPTLEQLRRHGYDAELVTGDPALSFPNWTTLVSGASQRISGVTTNWFEGRVPVETLFDVAARDRVPTVVVASKDFEPLYAVERFGRTYLVDTGEKGYKTARIVDEALRLVAEASATLVVVYSPDIDDAGHDFGGASPRYAEVAARVDSDLARLVDGLDDGETTFVVASDHGHIDTGGHGGFETEVTHVPTVLAGPDIALGSGAGTQEQVAPTVAALVGLSAPRNATAAPLIAVDAAIDLARFETERKAALAAYTAVVAEGLPRAERPGAPASAGAAAAGFSAATEARLAGERAARLPLGLAVAAVALAVIAAVGLLSWRALVSAFAGAVGYYLLYHGLFLVLHGYQWSLSAFNSESMLSAFFNARMLEAAASGLFAAFVAAEVYMALRGKDLVRPKGEYLPGWLALGTATVLTIQATIALQVAWYLWRWGVPLTWVLPDFEWAFKYDLDLIQVTALAVAALIAPLATFIVGRFHPFSGDVKRPRAAAAGAPEDG